MTDKPPTRIEKDSMGEMSLPASALHGASTHRAVMNFPVSGYRFSRPFIRALGLIKWAAAQANHDLGLLDAAVASVATQHGALVADVFHAFYAASAPSHVPCLAGLQIATPAGCDLHPSAAGHAVIA